MATDARLVFGVIGDIQTTNRPCMVGVSEVAANLRRLGATALLAGRGNEWRLVDLMDASDFDLGAACVRAFAEKAPSIVELEKNGVAFVLCNTKAIEAEAAQKFLKGRAAAYRERPVFFYVQTRYPKGTVFGDFVDGQDAGYATRLLANFPQAVAISSGGMGPLTDERAVWHGSFTSVATSSFRRAVLLPGRENVVPEGEVKKLRGDRQMPNLMDKPVRNRAGLLVSVFADRVEIARVALKNGERLGEDWVLPFADRAALSRERRLRRMAVPAFAPGAQARVNFVRGKTLKGVETDQVTVSFPKANPVRAYEYEVTVTSDEGDVNAIVAQKRVFSRGIVMPAAEEQDEVTCVFARKELYHELPLRFEVRPMDSFGRKGKPLIVGRMVKDSSVPSVSLTLPKRPEPYRSPHLFAFFSGLLAEGVQKDIQCRYLKIDENDDFGRLLRTSKFDCIGAVHVAPEGS